MVWAVLYSPDPPFRLEAIVLSLGPVKTCQLTTTLHYNILYGNWCKLIKTLDQMGSFHILLDEMGLD